MRIPHHILILGVTPGLLCLPAPGFADSTAGTPRLRIQSKFTSKLVVSGRV